MGAFEGVKLRVGLKPKDGLNVGKTRSGRGVKGRHKAKIGPFHWSWDRSG